MIGEAAVAAARAAYPVLERFAYLNTGTCGPLSEATAAVMAEWSERDLREGRGSPSRFDLIFDLRERLTAALAGLLGVPAANVVLTSSTTEGCNLAVTGLRLSPADEVVTTDAEHPGLEEPLKASGARIRVARLLGRPDSEALSAVLEQVTPRTRLIALSHVLWLNGQVLPIAEIRRQSGVPLLVDGAQSVGAIPIDAGVADFYTLSGQKWLCGPELTGALYVADPDSINPWMAGYSASHPEWGAARFTMEFHPVALLAGLLNAAGELPEWGFERAASMAARGRVLLAAAGFELVSGPGPGTLVSFVSPIEPVEAVARCAERGVVIRSLPNGWIRVSCGWWTTESDLRRLVEALA